MKITYTLSTGCTCENTPEENERYKDALWTKLIANYPDADITVKITDAPNYVCAAQVYDDITSDDDMTGEIAEDICWIANDIWGKSEY